MQVGIGKPTSNLHLVPRIGTCGLLPALPVMSSGMIITHRDKLMLWLSVDLGCKELWVCDSRKHPYLHKQVCISQGLL
jgi:hypothetical protein